ncbi:F-box domain [Macleaya cordata]|uniref:F-box domain n=1 Tax=Macleaya cordata TaxID=56857 RepID=A0A200QNU4_MACCD|nr:F-box domain [Macleaya cordata]
MENLLPTDIKLDIFSRLPAESVLQCRQVCKTRQTLLLHDPSFAEIHLRRQLLRLKFDEDQVVDEYHNNSNTTTNQFLFVALERKNQFYYGECDENDEQTASNDPVYICNPITREFIDLPRYDININEASVLKAGYMVSGFGYNPSTNEYKVVRICYSLEKPLIGQVQVYTLGGISFSTRSRWRNKSEINYVLCGDRNNRLRPGILANGALHWLDKEDKIVAFDLEDEEFRLLPSPPNCYRSDTRFYSVRLQVLGGCLCLIHQKNDKHVEIWSLKKKKKKKTKMSNISYDTKSEQEYQSWIWTREFTLELEDINQWYKPFAITKNRKILLWYDHKILLRYHEHKFGGGIRLLAELHMPFYCSEAISHVNSFVSLKALGE